MKSKLLTFMGLLVLAGLVLGACAQPAADDSQVTELQAQLDAALADAGASDEEIAALQEQLETAKEAAAAAAAAAAEAVPAEEPMEPQPVTLDYNFGTEPPTADPSLATDTTSSNLIGSIFMGLTDQDDVTKEIVPSLATSWASSEDKTVWTFQLRDDIPWVQYNTTTGEVDPVLDDDGNPRIVNANDVVYGVKRTCDPNTASDYAWLLYSIKGCEALNSADPSAEDFQDVYGAMSVVALDDFTVEFTTEFGAGFFPGVVSMANLYPTPQWIIEDKGDRWIEPGFIVTNGAYVMSEWVHGDHLILEKNPLWPLWGTDYGSGNIERIFGVTIEEASTSFAMYQNDELDTAGVPLEEVDRVKAEMASEFKNSPINCTYYYGFVTEKPPTDDVRVRKALSMGIDRATLVETVTKGGQIPANTFTNPLNFGQHAEDPDIAPWALTEEKGGTGYAKAVEMGKGLLAEAGFPNGAGLDILLMHNVSEGHARIAQAVQAMWQEAYPEMTVSVETQEWRVYLDTIRASSAIEQVPNVFRLGWCGDYPHANNWMHEVFNPDEGANRIRLSVDDPQVGDLVKEYAETTVAAQVASPAEADALYKRAEILLNDEIVGIAPIYYYTTVNVTKPWLERSFDQIKRHFFQWELDWDAKQAALEQ
ncbi:MAG: oligopeptide ABC transporter substrate-binding protein OppA [Anaerolineae bacterium]|nr:MAG: oligopeptide ABC transporter substrate-binding protein OppA [Anaerolineae bacterium]